MGDAEVIRIERHRAGRDGRSASASDGCGAQTASGRPCRNRARPSGYCARHEEVEAVAERSAFEAELERALAFLRRRVTGDYAIDDFGFDRDLTENVLMSLMRPLYEQWWRVELRGIENIPAEGSALLVANHSGTLPLDALMMRLGVFDATGRHCRLLTADLPFRLPFVGQMARKSGNTLACNEDATRLLKSGELVGVFPEGYKGVGKLFKDRYKLQRFGRGGFVEVALKTGAPIVPVAIIGAEEIYPLLYNIKPLARLLGFPYFPVTPTFPLLGPLGLIPLPSKWMMIFGEPIETAGMSDSAANDPMSVFNLTDQVRESIQQSLYRALMSRRGVFV